MMVRVRGGCIVEGTMSLSKKTSLFVLTWPIFIELVLQVLVNNVDQIMISRVSENAVAAIGNVNQIMNVLVITFSVVTMAATILVSQYLGSKRYNKISEIYSVAVFSNLAFSLIISIALFIFSDSIFALIKLPTELLGEAKLYMNIVGGGIFLQGIFMTYAAIFRSNGLMKQGMYISVMVNLINICGNSLLLYGVFGLPKLGIAGVAISSVVSRLVGVIVIMYMFKKKIKGNVSLKYMFPFPKATFRRIMVIGLPAGGESISYNASQMVILTFVNMMGTNVVMVRSYVTILAWFTFMFGSAVSQANQIRVGYLMGAGEEEEASRTVLDTIKPAVISSILIAFVLFFFSDSLIGMFTSNEEVLRLGKMVLFIDIFLEIGRAFNMVLVRGMQAAGDIKFPITVGILSMWVIATFLAYVFGISLGWGIGGVWIAMMLDECIRAVIFYIRWKKGSWRNKALI